MINLKFFILINKKLRKIKKIKYIFNINFWGFIFNKIDKKILLILFCYKKSSIRLIFLIKITYIKNFVKKFYFYFNFYKTNSLKD